MGSAMMPYILVDGRIVMSVQPELIGNDMMKIYLGPS